MKAISLICIFILLMAGYPSAKAQYGDDCYYFDGLYYWQVPCPASEDVPNEVDGLRTDLYGNGSQIDDNASRQKPVDGTFKSTAPPQGKILMVVPQSNYQELEFNGPRDYFQGQGFEVNTASNGTTAATGSAGETVSIDVDIKSINLSEYRAVVFVGGMGIDELRLYEDQDYLGLAKNASQKDLVIGAICLAPKILASAGLLSGKNATSSDPAYIQSKGAIYVDQMTVKSGKIITGSGPEASQEFAQVIVAALSEGGQTTEKLPVAEDTGNLVLDLRGTSDLAPSDQGTTAPAKWKCSVCSYIYDPAENNGVSFEQLPADWKCPVCGVGKDKFVML